MLRRSNSCGVQSLTYFIGLVRFDNQSVQVGVDIILWSNFFLDQMVLSLVVEDNMDFLA